MRTTLLIILTLAGAPVVAANNGSIYFGKFSTGNLDGWEKDGWNGETRYQLVEDDGRTVLRADCHNSSTGLVRHQTIDLKQTPILNWSWRVDRVFEKEDERSKGGDDFPARVYVIIDKGWLMWRSRAIGYVWSSNVPAGVHWSNPYTEQSMLMAVRSGPPERPSRWHQESRNVLADFQELFGIEPESINAVAVMSDCDNSGSHSTAYYGDIYFTAPQG